jgi:OST-HTH/LOTUS domain
VVGASSRFKVLNRCDRLSRIGTTISPSKIRKKLAGFLTKSAKSTDFIYAPQMSSRQGGFALFFFRREFAGKKARKNFECLRLANLAPDFDPGTFGFRKLSDPVRKTNAFEIDHPEGGTLRIRIKSEAAVKARRR